MSDVIAGFRYIGANWDHVGELFWQHIRISGIALLIALLIALPVGILLVRRPKLAGPVMSVLSILYTIPSLALLIMLIPLLGLGAKTAIATLVIYAQIILVRNIVVGLQSISPILIDAARGMGMSSWQRWWKVELPLALPIILAGVRIASVVIIGIAAIAATINAGGLGDLLFRGIQLLRPAMIWAGAISVSGLALVVNFSLLGLERLLDPTARVRRAQQRSQAAEQP